MKNHLMIPMAVAAALTLAACGTTADPAPSDMPPPPPPPPATDMAPAGGEPLPPLDPAPAM